MAHGISLVARANKIQSFRCKPLPPSLSLRPLHGPGNLKAAETGHEQQNILCECLLATAARHVTRPGAEAVTHSQHRRSDVSFCTKLEI